MTAPDPALTFPPELPVTQRREDIAAAIRDHQVVVVAGETGSGKTTQLPKICLALGRTSIGHTQPRRIAARSVAERIAQELRTDLGDVVGYTVRFTDKVSEQTRVRLMTDGILLAEIQRDPMLRRYDTILIDEAHERSLNIDFLLGYLHQLLPRRPDLKLVITSATIDSARFSAHFGNCPVIEVSGRTYPVEIRYRPVVDPEDPAADPDRDQVSAIVDAAAELQREGFGDTLVFLSGEREIRDAADGIGEAVRAGRLQETEIVPLFARLSAAEQHKVFAPHQGRRIVLATNVAETSLTVPGIRYVIDTGFARISRYSVRTKVQRLPIEPVSRASARQRAGRCGRVADGICIRLYTRADHEARPEYTDPEILRTNLASVILQMANIGLGEIADFGFLDMPDPRAVKDGMALLTELGALADGPPRRRRPQRDRPRPEPSPAGPWLSPLGRRLVRLPVDPRLARMILAADSLGCVEEVIVVAAALSIQDVRERPVDKQQAADEHHRRFTDPTSDFAAYLNLWRYLRAQQHALSGNAFRRMCRTEFLHFLRIREWQDLVAQLRRAARDARLTLSRTLPPEDDYGAVDADGDDTGEGRPGLDLDRIHQALLTGLLSQIAARDERASGQAGRAGQQARGGERRRRRQAEYLGARGVKAAIWPGSALARKPPELLMAAAMVETSRTWLRDVAAIDPEWAERAGAHLVKRQYSEPTWSHRRASAVAQERVTLYGVPIIADRTVPLGRVDPELARDLFIRHALVEGDWRTRHHFFHANRRTLDEAADLEHRSRRRDIVVGEEDLVAFYEQRLPPETVSGAHFDSWWRKARHQTPDLLHFTLDDLVRDDADEVDRQAYPDHWQVGDLDLSVGYRFEPGATEDGVTVTVPAAVLNQLDPGTFDWQVPGLRHDLVTALIRSLPKQYRRLLAPAPDTATKALAGLRPHAEPLLAGLARELTRLARTPIPQDAFDWDKVPAHLRVRVQVTGEQGRQVAAGKDVQAVTQASAATVRDAIAASAAAQGLDVTGLTDWTIATLPRQFAAAGPGGTVTGHPALVDNAGRVDVRVLPSRAEADRAMLAGTRRLLLGLIPPPSVTSLTDGWDSPARLALTRAPHPDLPALVHDVVGALITEVVLEHGPAWDAAAFQELKDLARARVQARAGEVLTLVGRVLGSARRVDAAITAATSLATLAGVNDAREHLSRLIRPGFVTATGTRRLPDLQRYLQGLLRRLERLPQNVQRDAGLLWQVEDVTARWRTAVEEADPATTGPEQLAELGWQLEELRVSLFAQGIPTPQPVSVERIDKALRRILTG